MIKSMEAAPNLFTKAPNNPFTIIKREREMREPGTDLQGWD